MAVINLDATERNTDVVLIGSGIMSATLGILLKELDPGLHIDIYEKLDEVAGESTGSWNNAGTGHSAFCEMNYTPTAADGSIDISKAKKIAGNFQESLQFWAYLVENEIIGPPDQFIRQTPHISFVWGDNNVRYLQKRYEALQVSDLFREMQYTENTKLLYEWMPLVMEGRTPTIRCAATKVDAGTDVDFGALTRQMFAYLKRQPGVSLHLGHAVKHLQKDENKKWRLQIKGLKSRQKKLVTAGFVFIGAGGGSLPLLIKSGIPESKYYGGFPVSGQWLKCKNPEIISRHKAKVYGLAAVGAPPMSVPHLDTRVIDGKRELLFGPYAGFTTKFLKKGSYLDLPFSIKKETLQPLVYAGLSNAPLTKYLIDQVSQSHEQRLRALEAYFPNAQPEDWELEEAGKRVQIIKKKSRYRGVLEFGTEVVSDADGTLAALLGASPGASTSATIMLHLLQRCFKDKLHSPQGQKIIKKMIPSFGIPLANNPQLLNEVRLRSHAALKISV